ncbi:MAG: hypothetical protein JNL65_09565 [Saprospiraceae bacterium]|nr:hypothetical protein [Saprospiraceae bacterium]HRG67377.1 hypothetical protein [Saprospiraceae bacterium]
MKNIIISISLILIYFKSYSQDPVQNFLKEASDFYGQKNYKQAQMSLQDAINELNKLMSEQVGNLLPTEINGLKEVAGGSSNTALGAMGGNQISKQYKNPALEENEAEIQILTNSPMMSAMNMYLSNPALMGEGAKSVRVGSQRAILKTEMTDYYGNSDVSKKIRSTQIQIPLSQTLITIQAKGFANEQAELAFAAKLDFVKIKQAVGE